MKLDLKEFYKLLVRPTIVISTISPNGVSNAAPFSWSSPLAIIPKPLFGFSSNVNHDTWKNVEENGEFVVNLVGDEFGPIMEIMERDFPYEVSANIVKPPRIQEAYGLLECRMAKYVPLSDRNVWVIGEVLQADVKDDALNVVVDVENVKPLNHIWDENFVTEMKITKFKRA